MTKEEILQDVQMTAAALIQKGDSKSSVITPDDIKFDGTYPWTAEDFYTALSDYMIEHNFYITRYDIENFLELLERDKAPENAFYITTAAFRWVACGDRYCFLPKDLPHIGVEDEGRFIAALLLTPYRSEMQVILLRRYEETKRYYPEIVEALSQIEINKRMVFISNLRKDYPEQNFRVFHLLIKSFQDDDKITYASHPQKFFYPWKSAPWACHDCQEIIALNHDLFQAFNTSQIDKAQYWAVLKKETEIIESGFSLILDSLYEEVLKADIKMPFSTENFKSILYKECAFLKSGEISAIENFNKDVFYCLKKEEIDADFCQEMVLKELGLITTAENAFFKELNDELYLPVLTRQIPFDFFLQIASKELEYQVNADISFLDHLNNKLQSLLTGMLYEDAKLYEKKLTEIILKEYAVFKKSVCVSISDLYEYFIFVCGRCRFNSEAFYKITQDVMTAPCTAKEREKLIVLISRLVATIKNRSDIREEAEKYYAFDPLIKIYQTFNFKPFKFL